MFMHEKKYEISCDTYILIDEDLGVHLEDQYKHKEIPLDLSSCVQDPSYDTKLDPYGRVEKIYSLSEGLRDGMAQELYDNGAVYWQGYYKKGLLHGPSRYFTKEGSILSVTWYFDGREQGESYQYYISSKVASITRSKDGLQEYYYESGAVKSSMNYNHGVIEGDVFLYFEDGKIKRKCFFLQGIKQGVDIILNRNEVVLDEGMYDKGVPCGTHIRRYDCGKIKEEIAYSPDKKTFSKKVWDEYGQLI